MVACATGDNPAAPPVIVDGGDMTDAVTDEPIAPADGGSHADASEAGNTGPVLPPDPVNSVQVVMYSDPQVHVSDVRGMADPRNPAFFAYVPTAREEVSHRTPFFSFSFISGTGTFKDMPQTRSDSRVARICPYTSAGIGSELAGCVAAELTGPIQLPTQFGNSPTLVPSNFVSLSYFVLHPLQPLVPGTQYLFQLNLGALLRPEVQAGSPAGDLRFLFGQFRAVDRGGSGPEVPPTMDIRSMALARVTEAGLFLDLEERMSFGSMIYALTNLQTTLSVPATGATTTFDAGQVRSASAGSPWQGWSVESYTPRAGLRPVFDKTFFLPAASLDAVAAGLFPQILNCGLSLILGPELRLQSDVGEVFASPTGLSLSASPYFPAGTCSHP